MDYGDSSSNQPGWLPYAVISIWILIALTVTIAALSNNPQREKAMELIVQVISALASAAAAIAAFLAVKVASNTLSQARADRRAELELKHPSFILQRGIASISLSEDGLHTYIAVSLINIGTNTAQEVSIKVFMLDENFHVEHVFYQTIANDVVSTTSFDFEQREYKLNSYDSRYYVNLRVMFTDKVTKKDYTEDFYYYWEPSGYRTRFNFEDTTREQKIEIKKGLDLYEKATASH